MLKLYLAVGAGGALGSIARYAFVTQAARMFGPAFPWGTLGVNILGSLLMGMCAGLFSARVTAPSELQAFLAIGILGGFTTFSAFSMDLLTLIERGHVSQAAVYALGSVGLSVAAVVLGLSLIRRLLT